MGLPRKLTVPTTLLFVIESMMSVPQIIVLPAIEEWIPQTDGNGKLTEAVPCEVTNAMPSLEGCLCSEEESLFKAVYAARAE